jgi:flagellar biosynthetic protein FlhB
VLVWPKLSEGLAATLDTAPTHTARHWSDLTLLLAGTFLAVFALFAIFDLWFSKRDFARQMRMSRRDLKDEYKRREGDPEIKAKRRRAQVEFLKRLGALGRVKDSDVIVTNPTHVAVALRYRHGQMPLPVTVAMGRGFIARAVLAIARRHRIPIVRKPALARALLKYGSPGAPIPYDRQLEVATVYRWVITLPGCKVLT